MTAAIKRQIDFYFSDKNYFRDGFLKGIANKHPEKFVPIESLLTFNKVKKLCSSVEEIVQAV